MAWPLVLRVLCRKACVEMQPAWAQRDMCGTCCIFKHGAAVSDRAERVRIAQRLVHCHDMHTYDD
eukprot:357367-Chlamydomonas_euryale.AAC.4